MRDKIILAVCLLGILSVFGAILYFGDAGQQGGDQGRPGGGPGGQQQGAAFHLGGSFFNQLFERHVDASQPVTGSSSTVRSGAGAVAGSPAGGFGAPVQFAVAPQVSPVRVCGGGGVLGAVLGLLGGLLGGGGGC